MQNPPEPAHLPPAGNASFRKARFKVALEEIDQILSEKPICRIIDVGGTVDYWDMLSESLGDRKIQVDIVNLHPFETRNPKYRSLVGNACDLSPFKGEGYDLAHSNSVIEHVGDWVNMQAMAEGISRIAPRYFVQVPYFWFPLEPHWRVPFLHWFADPIRAKFIRAFGFGSPPGQTVHVAMERAQGARILDKDQVRALFPDGRIVEERIAGVLTKSLMVVRKAAVALAP
jgi:hypothetical protein